MNKELDDIKYEIMDIRNNIDTKLRDIELLTQKLGQIWLRIEAINPLDEGDTNA